MDSEQSFARHGYDSMDVAAVWPTSASVAPFPVPDLEPISQRSEFRATPAAPDVPAAVGGLIAISYVVLIAALSPYDLMGTADFTLALFGYSVAVFAALTASALSGRLSHIRAALTMPFYWPLTSIAAVRALFEFAFRPHHWAKTAHGVSAREKLLAPAAATPRLLKLERTRQRRA